MGPLQSQLRDIIALRYPMMLKGIHEARDSNPFLVDEYFELCLEWIVKEFGQKALADIAEGYVMFTLEVNRSQLLYEKRGSYEFASFEEANRQVYQNAAYMRKYYWGIFAILFFWSHYVELVGFFLKRFVSRLRSESIIEIAPGHGFWGLMALNAKHGTKLEGWDISPSSLHLAPRIAEGAGLEARATYRLGDAMQTDCLGQRFDAGISSFMLEHLEDPGGFLMKFGKILNRGSLAYISLALTAAQTDHIFEFVSEAEAPLLAEAAGFEVVESCTAAPLRAARNAKRKPRVQAMILRKV